MSEIDTGNNGSLPAAPTGPTVVGELTEQARLAIQSLQQNQTNLQLQIGGLEIQKVRLLNSMEDIRQQIQRILQSEGARLGIPQNRQWQVTPDGKVVMTG